MKFAPVMPTFRYKNADQAIQFLVEGLGFVQRARYDAPDGTVAHAELTKGNSMVMLGTKKEKGMAQDGVDMDLGNGSVYVIVDTDGEVDKLYASALRAGGKSVMEPKNQDYGGRGATVRDPEGNYWSVGSYKPE